MYDLLKNVNRVERATPTEVNIETKPTNVGESKEAISKRCIYYPEYGCNVPNCKMEICANCPRGFVYSVANSIKSVYQRVTDMAIFLMEKVYANSKVEDSFKDQIPK